MLTGLGEVEVRVPKSRSRSGSAEPFRSSVVPPYVRRCASLDAAIPWLYLHGASTGQMRQAVAAPSTAFAESTVNTVVGKRFAKRKKMRWSNPGAQSAVETLA